MRLFSDESVHAKLAHLDQFLQCVLSDAALCPEIPSIPARDAQVLPVRAHPDKVGLHTKEGQARLLHDLASIELQAMELGLRTLAEFPEAPALFREELAEITRGEGTHLRLCLAGIDALGFEWGRWPVHTALWECVSSKDSLLDRILIVHRYLEGSGLDAGDSILRRLSGVDSRIVRASVETIVREEIDHVNFGSRWYRERCRAEGLDPAEDFPVRLEKHRWSLPRRMEVVCRPLREAAGFDASEIACLERLRGERLREGRTQ